MILDKILHVKKQEVRQRMVEVPYSDLFPALRSTNVIDFAGPLQRNDKGLPAVIAEVKKASPSKGVIREDFDPVAIAMSYEAAGASAISVLTDEQFFQGSLDYLRQVKAAVSVPVLRKDFIVDEYQIFEARAAGADAVLLIAAVLRKDRLAHFMYSTHRLGMQALVEVHNGSELATAVELGADLVGINNRNLRTFEVDLNVTANLAPAAAGRKIVSESGIFTRADMVKLGAMGVDAVLIGEALMRERDIEAKLRELIG